jgi:Holliday junction resolvasome RuvABC ATP-dependent DNA helicase subunit
MPIFTPHQDSALKAVADWLKAKHGKNGTPPIFRLFGYAGTGKTTLARHIAEGVDGEVKFAALYRQGRPGDAQQGLRQRVDDTLADLPRARIRRGAAEF